jgi:alpha-methylacyl-CoA racemase
MSGPLSGYRILELAGIGPGPFCGMMLADMGAEVIRIDRPGGNPMGEMGHEVLFRNRRTLALDLKNQESAGIVLKLCETADAIFEGFRPGVAERLGVGPEPCLARNPKLVYGRMTGWGQTGPLASAAGHDINYISLSGALHAIGRAGSKPVPPLNLVGDFGGGAMMLAFGMVCAMLEAQKSGRGQVVDASMVEGSAALMAMFFGFKSQGLFSDQRGTHLLDTGVPFYEVYETSDGKFVSIGSLEPQFYSLLIEKTGLDKARFGAQMNKAIWPALQEALRAKFREKTRDEWTALLEGSDVCFAPILSISEAPQHPHNLARQSFIKVDGMTQPAPTPRFSRSIADSPTPKGRVGADTHAILSEAGYSEDQITALVNTKAIRCL